MAGYPILDPIAGLLVSGLIAVQGGKTTLDAFKDLSDRPASKKETEALR
jgi:divalent metal cation (Fe/Co/Zn/Cd) transporter